MNHCKKKGCGIFPTDFPFDCWTVIISFFDSSETFYSCVYSIKGLYNYIKRYPSCCSQISFTVKEPLPPIVRPCEFVYKLNFGEPSTLSFVNESNFPNVKVLNLSPKCEETTNSNQDSTPENESDINTQQIEFLFEGLQIEELFFKGKKNVSLVVRKCEKLKVLDVTMEGKLICSECQRIEIVRVKNSANMWDHPNPLTVTLDGVHRRQKETLQKLCEDDTSDLANLGEMPTGSVCKLPFLRVLELVGFVYLKDGIVEGLEKLETLRISSFQDGECLELVQYLPSIKKVIITGCRSVTLRHVSPETLTIGVEARWVSLIDYDPSKLKHASIRCEHFSSKPALTSCNTLVHLEHNTSDLTKREFMKDVCTNLKNLESLTYFDCPDGGSIRKIVSPMNLPNLKKLRFSDLCMCGRDTYQISYLPLLEEVEGCFRADAFLSEVFAFPNLTKMTCRLYTFGRAGLNREFFKRNPKVEKVDFNILGEFIDWENRGRDSETANEFGCVEVRGGETCQVNELKISTDQDCHCCPCQFAIQIEDLPMVETLKISNYLPDFEHMPVQFHSFLDQSCRIQINTKKMKNLQHLSLQNCALPKGEFDYLHRTITLDWLKQETDSDKKKTLNVGSCKGEVKILLKEWKDVKLHKLNMKSTDTVFVTAKKEGEEDWFSVEKLEIGNFRFFRNWKKEHYKYQMYPKFQGLRSLKSIVQYSFYFRPKNYEMLTLPFLPRPENHEKLEKIKTSFCQGFPRVLCRYPNLKVVRLRYTYRGNGKDDSAYEKKECSVVLESLPNLEVFEFQWDKGAGASKRRYVWSVLEGHQDFIKFKCRNLPRLKKLVLPKIVECVLETLPEITEIVFVHTSKLKVLDLMRLENRGLCRIVIGENAKIEEIIRNPKIEIENEDTLVVRD